MKLTELIHDISKLNVELTYLKKLEFNHLNLAITAGELEEFDALDEYRMEFIE